jgi:dihydroorotate dehydrogenase electron transfer subunit
LFIVDAPVEETIELENKIYLLKIDCPKISKIVKPGQFLNIKVSGSVFPLLRRPFSVCDVEGDFFYLMFNIYGEGTKILAHKTKGDTVDVLGPLGNGFNLSGDFKTAVIIAGGLGAAPFPYFTRAISPTKNILTFIGGRTKNDIITYGLKNVSISTDDGSAGLKGNVIDLLNENLSQLKKDKVKLFACGPTAMLKALKVFCEEHDFDCDASTECAMACGFGICQGCPIEAVNNPDKYYLVCKDGPVFNIRDVIL